MKRAVKTQGITLEDVQASAENVYIYGYPLLVMDALRRAHTAVSQPVLRSAPVNQFVHAQFLPGPYDKQGAHSNADSLFSSAWLDLNREPIVLSVPENARYHLLSFWSGWYEIFETISPRNTGVDGGRFALTGPRWSGELPCGLTRIVSPTATVWIDGYFEVDGVEDIPLVGRVQDQLRLTPLSQWGNPQAIPHIPPFRPDVDQTATAQDQVAGLDARGFYTRLSKLMQSNPAQPCDSGMVAEFARAGFFPGEDFEFEKLPALTAQAMHLAVPAAQVKIANSDKNVRGGRTINNWSLHIHPGRYQTNYLDRAAAARIGVAAARAEDVVCFNTALDHTGEPLQGSRQYAVHFSQDRMPPVNAFWSVTLYDSRQHLILNDIHRYVIGDRNRLRHNPDNSLSIHIQHDWPGTSRDSNWLPTPKDTFNLALRLYWPKADVFTGKWRPPFVMRTN